MKNVMYSCKECAITINLFNYRVKIVKISTKNDLVHRTFMEPKKKFSYLQAS